MKLDFPATVFVMAGGSGERFWPLSRKQLPKHLLKLFSDRTLLEESLLRVKDLVPHERLIVLTSAAQAAATRAAIPWLPAHQVIVEPAKRDTGPAAALANGIAMGHAKESLVVMLPADQLVNDAEIFRRNLTDAAGLAWTSDSIATLSIRPTYASTGFGYLELADALPDCKGGSKAFKVGRFVEKPNLEKANEYLASGAFGWNAGIFVWKTTTFQNEAERLAPELAAFSKQYAAQKTDVFLNEAFPLLPKISVDYAVMEKASSVAAVQAEFEWDDVGSWTALPAHLPQDPSGNTLRGNVVMEDSKNNIVYSTGRTVALCGVENLIIVDAGDSILVCHKDRAQDVKKLLPQLPDALL